MSRYALAWVLGFGLCALQAGCGGAANSPPSAGPPPPSGQTIRVSVSSSGVEANGLSDRPSLSDDGRFVAFEGANASNLVAGDSNSVADIFVRDLVAGTTSRVSVDSAGGQSNNGSAFASISADGRWVAFQSIATNLAPLDTNGQIDVFVHDRQTGTTRRVSVTSRGEQVRVGGGAPSISADGRYVAFMSPTPEFAAGDLNGTWDVFVHDLQQGLTTVASVDGGGTLGDGPSTSPAISGDGRLVAFFSAASNLTPNDTNAAVDLFVHDRDADGDGVFDEAGAVATTRVSVDSAGNQGNADTGVLGSDEDRYLSRDGRLVVFSSGASNLAPGDTNGVSDVFLHDRQTGVTTRLSVTGTGAQGNGPSFSPQFSSEGRFVTFGSLASNLVSGDTNAAADVFLYDRQAGTLTRPSVSSMGSQGNGHSAQGDAGFEPPSVSASGRFIAFASAASNLVSGDTNGTWDIFVHERE